MIFSYTHIMSLIILVICFKSHFYYHHSLLSTVSLSVIQITCSMDILKEKFLKSFRSWKMTASFSILFGMRVCLCVAHPCCIWRLPIGPLVTIIATPVTPTASQSLFQVTQISFNNTPKCKSCAAGSLLQLPVLILIIAANPFMCLIYKWSVLPKKLNVTVNIGVGTICNFRRPLGCWSVSLKIRECCLLLCARLCDECLDINWLISPNRLRKCHPCRVKLRDSRAKQVDQW